MQVLGGKLVAARRTTWPGTGKKKVACEYPYPHLDARLFGVYGSGPKQAPICIAQIPGKEKSLPVVLAQIFVDGRRAVKLNFTSMALGARLAARRPQDRQSSRCRRLEAMDRNSESLTRNEVSDVISN